MNADQKKKRNVIEKNEQEAALMSEVLSDGTIALYVQCGWLRNIAVDAPFLRKILIFSLFFF